MSVSTGRRQLSDGSWMPLLGFGTWKSEPEMVGNAVSAAIDAGYRHIDGAYSYLNEAEVGAAVKKKIGEGVVTREDLFIVSKNVPGELLPRREGSVLVSEVDYVDTWKAMEALVDDGLVKSIGVSNFNISQLQRLLSKARIFPAVNQVELHPYLTQPELVEFCTSRNIALTAYSPLGSPGRSLAFLNDSADPKDLLGDPVVKMIADKHSKSPAQILLRFHIQRNIATIPKSVSPERIRQNTEVFDFELTEDDLQLLLGLNRNWRVCQMKMVRDHRFYPFTDF
ncbi:aldo-keto reductase family 1 member B1 isoform X2 [Rhinoraja longicauda]